MAYATNWFPFSTVVGKAADYETIFSSISFPLPLVVGLAVLRLPPLQQLNLKSTKKHRNTTIHHDVWEQGRKHDLAAPWRAPFFLTILHKLRYLEPRISFRRFSPPPPRSVGILLLMMMLLLMPYCCCCCCCCLTYVYSLSLCTEHSCSLIKMWVSWNCCCCCCWFTTSPYPLRGQHIEAHKHTNTRTTVDLVVERAETLHQDNSFSQTERKIGSTRGIYPGSRLYWTRTATTVRKTRKRFVRRSFLMLSYKRGRKCYRNKIC